MCALQTVQRQSLRQIMPDAGAVMRNMFKTLHIQEPAFKNVVVLYRRKVAATPQRKSEYEPIRSHNLVRPFNLFPSFRVYGLHFTTSKPLIPDPFLQYLKHVLPAVNEGTMQP